MYNLKIAGFADYDFLKRVHHSTLKDHIAKIWGWDESRQDQFFAEEFKMGKIQVIQAFDKDVGYLHVQRRDGYLFILNLLILPEFQSRGLGSAILKNLIEESRREGLSLRLGVFKINTRAQGLYEELGFQLMGETETHYLMDI